MKMMGKRVNHSGHTVIIYIIFICTNLTDRLSKTKFSIRMNLARY